MIQLSSVDFTYWLGLYFWPFVRILALLTTAPIFYEKSFTSRGKIGLALLAAILLAPQLPVVSTPIFSAPGVWLLIKQLLIGVSIGFTMQLAFALFRVAGEFIGMQMGLSFATFIDPAMGGNTSVLSRLFNILATMLFLVFNGHLWMISLLADSFHVIPVNPDPLNTTVFLTIARTGSLVFLNGLMLALPLMTFLLVINISLGILNRMTPQLSIFVIGFPITLTVGIIIIGLLLPLFAPYAEHVFSEMFDLIATMIQTFPVR